MTYEQLLETNYQFMHIGNKDYVKEYTINDHDYENIGEVLSQFENVNFNEWIEGSPVFTARTPISKLNVTIAFYN